MMLANPVVEAGADKPEASQDLGDCFFACEEFNKGEWRPGVKLRQSYSQNEWQEADDQPTYESHICTMALDAALDDIRLRST